MAETLASVALIASTSVAQTYAAKNEPLRSRPISANELEDVDSGSDLKVKSPTAALHSI